MCPALVNSTVWPASTAWWAILRAIMVAEEDDVGGIQDEAQAHQLLDGRAVALGRPVPIAVGQGFEAPQVGVAQAPFQAAAGAFLLFPIEQRR
jgi:hypothetical protein